MLLEIRYLEPFLRVSPGVVKWGWHHESPGNGDGAPCRIANQPLQVIAAMGGHRRVGMSGKVMLADTARTAQSLGLSPLLPRPDTACARCLMEIDNHQALQEKSEENAPCHHAAVTNPRYPARAMLRKNRIRIYFCNRGNGVRVNYHLLRAVSVASPPL